MATFIRNEAEIAAVAAYRPFKDCPPTSPVPSWWDSCASHSTPPRKRAVLALKTEIDDLHVNGRELYWHTAGGQSDSTLSNALFERTLKGKATFRNINTVTRLAARYPVKGT